METTVLPKGGAIPSELTSLHLEQFREAVAYRLRLIEAVLRLAKVDIHLL